MIGFVLGTGEGRAILSHVNKYTDEIVVSTATEYGYEIYKEFKAKHFNYRPLNEDEFKDLITKFGIDTFVDIIAGGSRPRHSMLSAMPK